MFMSFLSGRHRYFSHAPHALRTGVPRRPYRVRPPTIFFELRRHLIRAMADNLRRYLIIHRFSDCNRDGSEICLNSAVGKDWGERRTEIDLASRPTEDDLSVAASSFTDDRHLPDHVTVRVVPFAIGGENPLDPIAL